MLQITTDISTLTKDQREMLAGFILTFDLPKSEQMLLKLPAAEVMSETQPNLADVFPIEAPSSGPQLVQDVPATVTFDKAGLPWDDRIHAGSKVLTTDGLWRKKRGVTDELVAQVEAELRAISDVPAPPVPVPPVPTSTGPDPVKIKAYTDLMGATAKAIGAKVLTPETLAGVLATFGLESLPKLALNLDLVPKVAEALNL